MFESLSFFPLLENSDTWDMFAVSWDFQSIFQKQHATERKWSFGVLTISIFQPYSKDCQIVPCFLKSRPWGGTFWFLKVTSDYALLNGHRLEDWVWWMLKVLYVPRMFQIFLETCTRILESFLISCTKPDFAWHSLVIVIWPYISWLFTADIHLKGSWNTLNKSKWQGTQMTDYWFATSRTPQFFHVWDPRYAC